MTERTDIAIIGGGLAGMSFALSLADTGLSIALIEGKLVSQLTVKNSDKRTLVLSIGSMRILDKLGIGADLIERAYPLKKIHVSEKGSFGKTRFFARDYQVPALGYVTPIVALQKALYEAISNHPQITWYHDQVAYIEQGAEQTQLTLKCGAILHCALCVGADGANSMVRDQLNIPIVEKESDHLALVSSFTFETPLNNTAFERFYQKTVLAVIPRSDQTAGFVVTGQREAVESLNALTNHDFQTTIQQQLGFRIGRIQSVDQRVLFPLKHFEVSRAVQDHTVLIGQAARTFHPIAAQGFNLTLRDIALLAQLITKANANDTFFDMAWLKEYEQARANDQKYTMQLTRQLTYLFESALPFARASRSVGLLMMDLLSPLKTRFARRLMGLNNRLSC